MPSKLVIMESPVKSKAVQSYLGNDYLVLSSDGHIRNLAIKGQYGLGIDLETFEPIYKIDRKKMPKVKELKSKLKSITHVYLATDHDREGEAIAYHLDQVLATSNISSRITFNEITKDAILTAFKSPHSIDLPLVRSQEARRMVDRIIGFRLSNLLQKKIGSRSAGRVQSVALKLIATRECEIINFISKEFWTINSTYQKKIILNCEKYKEELLVINNEQEAVAIKNALSDSYQVISVTEQNRKRNSLNPFTTSSLLQAASTQLNFSTAKTTLIAQQLYEGIDFNGTLTGFISYPRTDSIRLNDKFIENAKTLIVNEYGEQYLGQKKEQTNKKNVQDAHEAIRPTDLTMNNKRAIDFLNKDQLKLYNLIYFRALSSLMAPAQLISTTVLFKNNDYQFRLTGQQIKFKGFLMLDVESLENEELLVLPKFEKNQIIKVESVNLQQHFTKPKPRYTEAKLIKTLEELGIGRPSTYNPIMNTIKERGYVIIENKSFKATEKGLLTNDKLQEFFYDIINETYTSQVETQLDQIAHGNFDMHQVVKDFWVKFEPRIDDAFDKMTEFKIKPVLLDQDCPLCGAPLVQRTGRYGKFNGCSAFPKCRYIQKQLEKNKPCLVCTDGWMVVKSSKQNRKFLGCTNYPNCKHVEKYQEVTSDKEVK
ncbi:type I DNA topoisomerase [Spiroplasma endosymbiont of Lasioglossum malachurum]|uniref:type I DNA topoisomerase n=1 Tax=Spiroplasma endosymbiont of Lasioglossum malachurum TaxID=3066319 RepID=UPI0030D0C690